MPLLVSDAIVLHAFDYLESSRILRLATREGGLRSALAKGARRSERRFGSALDLFAQGTVQLSTKPGRDLDTMTGFDIVESRSGLAEDLGRFAGASAIAELVLLVSSENADPGLFDAIAATLDGITAASPDQTVEAALGGAWHVIAALGFTPSLSECAECRVDLADDAVVTFHHTAGGALCDRCARLVPGGRRMPSDARTSLIAWTAGGRVAALDPQAARAHQRLLREFLQQHILDGRPLKAYAVWEAGSWGAT